MIITFRKTLLQYSMKKIYIIRHAKSSWSDLSLDDFDRPLNKRGIRDAPFMGEQLKNKAVNPDLILSSPALRAKTTAKTIAKKIGYKKEIFYDENIYEASFYDLLEILKSQDNTKSILFLFGHNPGLNMLTGELIDFYENIPTCGIVEIEFSCEKWKEISSKNSKMISFDYPKKYK